ncbi:MAG: hypothetical protein EXX96DRAFT_588343 [Benjaminiella poitrasii]|nr:MAG: hypothetical protein EXX96DRAFT_588343 [Benjaminiella poitrasii]
MLNAIKTLKLERNNSGSAYKTKINSLLIKLVNTFHRDPKSKKVEPSQSQKKKRSSFSLFIRRRSHSLLAGNNKTSNNPYSKDAIFERNSYNEKKRRTSDEQSQHGQRDSSLLQGTSTLSNESQTCTLSNKSQIAERCTLPGILVNRSNHRSNTTSSAIYVKPSRYQHRYTRSSPSNLLNKSNTVKRNHNNASPNRYSHISSTTAVSNLVTGSFISDAATAEIKMTTGTENVMMNNDFWTISQFRKMDCLHCSRYDEGVGTPSLIAASSSRLSHYYSHINSSSIYINSSSELMTLNDTTSSVYQPMLHIWDPDFWRHPSAVDQVEDYIVQVPEKLVTVMPTPILIKPVPKAPLITTAAIEPVHIPRLTTKSSLLEPQDFPILIELRQHLVYNPESQKKEAHVRKGRFDIYLESNI